MPDSSWRNRGPVVVVALAFAGILAIAWIAHEPPDKAVGWEALTSTEYPAEHYGPTEGHWLPEFSARDTYAQWIMAVLSLAATFVSIWAVVLVRNTLVETRNAVRSAQEANRISRQIGNEQLRAYVQIQDPSLRWRGGKALFTVWCNNTGETPVRYFEIGFVCEVIPVTDPRHGIVPDELDYDGWSGLAAKDTRSAPLYPVRPYVDREEITDGLCVSLRGRIRYETVFGEFFESEFSFFADREMIIQGDAMSIPATGRMRMYERAVEQRPKHAIQNEGG